MKTFSTSGTVKHEIGRGAFNFIQVVNDHKPEPDRLRCLNFVNRGAVQRLLVKKVDHDASER